MADEAKNLLKEYEDLQKKYKAEQEKAKKSKSYATTGLVSPTKSDLEREKSLREMSAKAETLMSEYQKLRWYGSEEEQKKKQELFDKLTPEEKRQEGLFSKGLNLLSTPLYATVGAAESALGKGSKAGLFENIQANVKEREAFGDLIRKYGVNNWIATPLGLALDIALDPLNWATMGTGALVPRIAAGAYKGARAGEGVLAGLRAGVRSGIGQKGAQIAKYTPIFKGTEKAQEIQRWASREMDWFNKVVGKNDPIAQMAGTNAVRKLTDKFSDVINRTGKGDEIRAAFKYEPTKTLKTSMQHEDILRRYQQVGSGEEAMDILASTRKGKKNFIDEILDHDYVDPNELVKGEASKATEILGDSSGRFRSPSGAENAARIAEEAARDREMVGVVQKMQEIMQDKTGIRLIDETKDKIGKAIEARNPKLKKALNKTADAYKAFIGHFKISKVPLSPSAYTNALLGNAIMTKMSGLDLSPQLRSDIYQALKMLNGKKVDAKFIKKLVANDKVAKFIEEYPRTFTLAFGVSPDVLRDRRLILNKLDSIKNMKGATKAKISEIFDMGAKEMSEFMRPYKAGKRLEETGRAAGNIPAGFYGTPTTYSADVLAGMGDVQRRILQRLREVEGPYAKQFAKFYESYLTKPMNWYESIDQSYKLGIFTHLTNTGISRKEFDILKKMLPIGADDFTKVKNYDLYKLAPAKAAEVSQEVYMNYRALPGVVKALRNAPIIGAPFASFMYAMAHKTGKTALYNPAFFTKMNSMMAEISGGQDPAERKNLESIYNSYLNQPGMMKLPITQDNPLYLRVEQMLPYYSLNIFQPGARDLEPGFAKNVTEVMDKTGLFSDPVGQVLFNYLVLPDVLREELPKGLFGQRLYPEDATAAQKTAYAARDIAEAATPPVIGPAGTLAGTWNRQAAPLPGDPFYKALPFSPVVGTEEYFPSFRWRQFARAARGQTSVGVEGQEDPVSRWARALSSLLGAPVYRTNIYTSDITE